MVETSETAKASIETISSKLTHAVEQLKKHVQADGKLDPYDQHAVRILHSRQRVLQAIWDFLYSSGQEQERARISLTVLAHSDDGTLKQIGEKLHSLSRWDCRACDLVENAAGERVVGTKLCPHCQKGLMHLYTAKKEEGGYVPPPTPPANALRTRHEPVDGEVIVTLTQVFECDHCGRQEERQIRRDTVKPRTGMRTFLIPGAK